MNFIYRYFSTNLQNHIIDSNNYINMHRNLEISDEISDDTVLKLRAITGYIWGIDSITFDKKSGARFCQRTSMSYTLDALELENTKLKNLRENFFQDYRTMSTLEEADALLTSLTELKINSEKILKCLNCVLNTYQTANKEKNRASIPVLAEAVNNFASEIEEISQLHNLVAFAKHEMANQESDGVIDSSEAIQIFDTQSNDWTINQDQERAALQKRLVNRLNVGDFERSRVTISGEHFGQLHLEEKRAKLLEFAKGDELLVENIIKLAIQGLPAATGVPMTLAFGIQGYLMTSDGENIEKGLKSIEIERAGNDLKITMKGVYSFSHMNDAATPLIIIDQTVTATIPENDLLEGRCDTLFLENTFVRRA